MELKFDKSCRSLTVILHEEIDHHTSGALRRKIDDAVINQGAENIIFDFSDVKFTDSSAIGLIMGRKKFISPLGGKVILSGMGKREEKLFSMSGIYAIAEKCENIAEAKKLLKEGVRR